MSITTRLVSCAAVLVTALAVWGASDAAAANYYNIVNSQTGRALEGTVDDRVKLAAPDPGNLLQQWKSINGVNSGPLFVSALDNRLLGCLRSDSDGSNLVADLKLGLCDGSSTDARKRWTQLWGNLTANPSVPGYELVNTNSAERIGEEFCFFTCAPVPRPTLYAASLVASDPGAFGASVKWEFRFVTSAP
jgi:hypothetical protein